MEEFILLLQGFSEMMLYLRKFLIVSQAQQDLAFLDCFEIVLPLEKHHRLTF